MPITSTSIDGLLVVDWPTFDDDRGFFRQTWQLSELEEALGRPVVFRQGNHARSQAGVVRAFHAEPWDKLVYVTSGVVLAAIADLRPDSPTFGTVETFVLGDPPGERRRLFLSNGLGNGYGVLEGPADYTYVVTEEYPGAVNKREVRWDDPDLGVDWGITAPVVSAEDAAAPTLRERHPDRF